jgi:predicted amidohydrolase
MRLLIILFLFLSITFSQTHSNQIVKIAVLQAGQKYCEACRINNPGPESHFNLYANLARQVAKKRPEVIVFPEYIQMGWPYLSEEKVLALAENIPGKGYWFQQYVQLAKELGIAIIGNMVERDEKKLFNTAVFLNEKGEFLGKYRKVHANLGEQTWWGFSQGEQFKIFEYHGIKYGFSICADMWFPETVRVNELLGADILIHQSIADDMDHIIPTRAFDSKLPIVAAIYQGGGYAVDNRGTLISKMDPQEADYKIFEIKPFDLEIHHKYGGKWIPKIGRQNLRNLEAYKPLLDPALRPPWTKIFLSEQGEPQTREELLQRFSNRYDTNDPTPYHAKLFAFPSPWTSPYKIDPNYPHHLVNKEGNHLFVINKTAWAYFGCLYPEMVLNRAKAQGINILRVALEGTPYFNFLGLDMWPWGGTRDNPDWLTINETYWAEIERRIQMAGKQGIGIDLSIYFTLKPDEADIIYQRYYWQTILDRLAKYSNIFCWEIQNEYTKNETF